MATERIGALIRERREHQGRSQMRLALDAGISPRHLSFVELGKSRPSREVVELIADRLGVSLRERSSWLVAAGYAPRHPESDLGGDALRHVRHSLQALLDAHDPFPAVVIDRRWTVQLTNRSAIRLADGIPDHARGVPTNIFRVCLHPEGFAPRTIDFEQWSAHLLCELDAAIGRTQDRELVELAAEVAAWPRIPPRQEWARPRFQPDADPVVTWRVEVDGQALALFTTLSVFGAPLDVTLSELAIELFFAADDTTEPALRALLGTEPHHKVDA